MKNIPLFIFLFTVLSAAAQPFTSSNLPIIIIDTHGQTIVDDPRIIVDMSIINHLDGSRNFMTDTADDYKGRVEIEIRGSTSQQYPKKSYAFSPIDSLDSVTNAMPLGLPAENDFIIYGPYPDKTLIRNTFTYNLANRMGHYDTRTRFCEMVINGVYMGEYEMMEKIKRDHNRVNIAHLFPTDTTGDQLTGGYIIKIDKTTGSGDSVWYSAYDPMVFFQFHDPGDADMVQVQRDYIRNYMNKFETALQSSYFSNPDSGFRKYADVNSFIDFFLIEELGRTVDGFRSSCFMFKDRDSVGGKLTMGPMWDFNLSYGNANYCSAYDSMGYQYQFNNICSGYNPHVPFWWGRLLQDVQYQNQLQCRWRELRQTVLNTDSVNLWIDSVTAVLNESMTRNFITWPILGVYVNWNYVYPPTYAEEIDYLKTWIAKRSKWMDNHLPGTCINTNVALADENDFGISPNPASDMLYMKWKNFSSEENIITVADVTGRTLLQKNIPAGISSFDFNVAALSRGIYFVSVNGVARRFAKM